MQVETDKSAVATFTLIHQERTAHTNISDIIYMHIAYVVTEQTVEKSTNTDEEFDEKRSEPKSKRNEMLGQLLQFYYPGNTDLSRNFLYPRIRRLDVQAMKTQPQ